LPPAKLQGNHYPGGHANQSPEDGGIHEIPDDGVVKFDGRFLTSRGLECGISFALHGLENGGLEKTLLGKMVVQGRKQAAPKAGVVVWAKRSFWVPQDVAILVFLT
jgi:hypothetical protein